MAHVRDMGDANYGKIQSIYYLTTVALEVPSGVVADRLGRRWTLAIGALGAALGSFGCAMAHDFMTFACSEVLFAVGTAFISGADSALLYDSLAAQGRQHEYPRAEAAAQAIWLVTSAIGFLCIDLFLWSGDTVDPTIAFWASGVMMLFGVGCALAMREPPRQRLTTRQITTGAMRDVFKLPGVLRLIAYSVGLFALLRMAIVMFFNPALKGSGLPVHLFGTVLAVVNIVGAFAAWKAGSVLQGRRARSLMIAMPIAMIVMFLGLGMSNSLGMAALFCLQGAVFGVYPLVMRTELNAMVPSADRRATVLSIESLSCRLAFAPIAALAGWSVESLGFGVGVALSVGVACLPFLLVPFLRRHGPVAGP